MRRGVSWCAGNGPIGGAARADGRRWPPRWRRCSRAWQRSTRAGATRAGARRSAMSSSGVTSRRRRGAADARAAGGKSSRSSALPCWPATAAPSRRCSWRRGTAPAPLRSAPAGCIAPAAPPTRPSPGSRRRRARSPGRCRRRARRDVPAGLRHRPRVRGGRDRAHAVPRAARQRRCGAPGPVGPRGVPRPPPRRRRGVRAAHAAGVRRRRQRGPVARRSPMRAGPVRRRDRLGGLLHDSYREVACAVMLLRMHFPHATAGIVAAATRSAVTAPPESRAGETGVVMPLSNVATSGMRRSAPGRKRTTPTRPTRSCTPTRSKGTVNP